MSKSGLKRKRIIVFGFEGKNNKTETNYFSHFKPYDSRYIFKFVSCGVTDPANMVSSIKTKRKEYDYNASEDITLLFIDSPFSLFGLKRLLFVSSILSSICQ